MKVNEIKRNIFESIIYTIDNFYKHPQDIKNYGEDGRNSLHKMDEKTINNIM